MKAFVFLVILLMSFGVLMLWLRGITYLSIGDDEEWWPFGVIGYGVSIAVFGGWVWLLFNTLVGSAV